MKSKLLSWTNRIVSIFLVCVGIFVLIYSFMELKFGSFTNPKGGFTPIIFSIGLILFGTINTVFEFLKKPEIPEKLNDIHWGKWILYMVGCALYVYLIDKVGYFIDTLITAFFLFAMFNYAMKIVLPKASWF